MAIQVTTQTFEQEVLKIPQPVLVDFYADWCGPCKMVSPILDEVARERSDLKLVKVNVDDDPELARRHGILSIPTLVLYQGGNVKANWVGLRSKNVLLQDINQALQKV